MRKVTKKLILIGFIIVLFISSSGYVTKADEVVQEELLEERLEEELLDDSVDEDDLDPDDESVQLSDAEESEEHYNRHPTGHIDVPEESDFESLNEGNGDYSLSGSYLPSSYISKNLPLTRNQGSYGTCWAHSAMALAEIGQNDSSADYSELQLAYFSYHTPLDPLGGLNGDYNFIKGDYDFLNYGGNVSCAARVLANWIGIVHESTAPYNTANPYMSIDTSKAYSLDIRHLQNYYKVDPVNDIEGAKQLIYDFGAMGISYYSQDNEDYPDKFPYRFEEVFNSTYDSYYVPITHSTNHEVTVVGWNDNFSRYNFNYTPEGDGAWLVRNSWDSGKDSSSRGYDTYFWLSYYDKTIKDAAYAYVTEDADNYDNNYQYDGSMFSSYINISKEENTKSANVFTAKAGTVGEELKAVAFSTISSNVSYSISVYTGVEEDMPESGELCATLEGTTSYAGYYTIKLDEPILLYPGELFSVVVSLDNASIEMEMSYNKDKDSGWSANAYISEGQSYYFDGYSWIDIDGFFEDAGNIRIKAFTDKSSANISAVNFDSNGGTVDVSSKAVKYGDAYGDLPVPSRAGYEFLGWYTASTGGSLVTESTTVLKNSEHTLYAHWNICEYYVYFDPNGGNCDVTSKKVYYYKAIGSLPTPSKTGYTFDGWYTTVSGGTKVLSTTVFGGSKDMILYAHWSATKYIVTFDPNGGSFASSSGYSASIQYNTNYFLPSSNPTRTGYTFAGWYTAESDGTKVTASTTMLTASDHTVYAHWTVKSYTIYAYVNGGSWDGGSTNTLGISVTYDGDYSIATPKRMGYKFLGWYTASSGGTKVESSGKYTWTSNLNVYAHWSINSYTITFNPNGGQLNSSSDATKSITYNSYYSLPSNPSRTGYKFDGWYTSIRNGTKITNSTRMTNAANHSLYAHWTPNNYTVYLSANGGTCSTDSIIVTFDGEIGELPEITKNGYDFAGWYNSATDGEKITSDTKYTDIGLKYLYAYWTPKSYTITFDPNGGRLNSEDDSLRQITYYTNYSFPVDPTREYCAFDGWYTMASGGTKISTATIMTRPTDHTLYAHWKGISVKVTFNTVGGTISGSNVVYEQYGSNYSFPIEPVKRGYDFAGWYTNSDYDTKVTTVNTVDTTSEHTLYAKWVPKTYLMVFDATDGELEPGTQKTVIYGETFGELPEPIYTNHIFKGWFTSAGGSLQIKSEMVVSEDVINVNNTTVTVYARWDDIFTADDLGDITEVDLAMLENKLQYEIENGISAPESTILDVIPQGIWISGLTTYENGQKKPVNFEFTGSAIKPAVRIYDGVKLLKEKTDYTLSYKNNTKAYTFVENDYEFEAKTAPSIIVSSKGNYTGKATAYFSIQRKKISDENISITEPADIIYNAKKDYKPVPKVTYNKKKLSNKKDFVISYYSDSSCTLSANPRDVGNYYIKIEGTGNYTGEVIKSFAINASEKKLVSKLTVGKISNQTYASGTKVEPKITVKDGKKLLSEKTEDNPYGNYTVTYQNNTEIGVATAIITGADGTYVGTKSVNFNIVGTSLKSATVGGAILSKTYTGEEIKQSNIWLYPKVKSGMPFVSVNCIEKEKYDKLEPENKKKYGAIITYSNNINAGTATMTFTGVNGYSGSIKKTFKISAINLLTNYSQIELDKAEYPYTKAGVRPEPTVTYKGEKLIKGKDYTVSYSNNTITGTNTNKIPTVKIVGKGNYSGTTSVAFKIVPASIDSERIIVTVSDKIFSNKAGNWKSGVTVTNDGKRLSAGKDYEKNVEYTYYFIPEGGIIRDGSIKTKPEIYRKAASESSPGDYVGAKDIVPAGTIIKAKVTAKGSYYTGTTERFYKIAAKNINKVTVKVSPKYYTGKEITLSDDDLSFYSGKNKLSDVTYEIVEDSYSNNIKKGKASVTIRGIGNYGGTKKITFSIGAKGFVWWISNLLGQ